MNDNTNFRIITSPKNKNYDELLFETAREVVLLGINIGSLGQIITSPVGVGYLLYCGLGY
jgi:hypothetical protein